MMKFFKYCYFAAALLWVGLLAYVQWMQLPSLRRCVLEEGGVAALSSLNSIIEPLKSCSNAMAISAIAILAALTAIVIAFGLKRGYILAAYRSLEKSRKEWVAIVIIAALAALPYLSPGNVALGDAMQFSALSAYAREALASGANPLGWSPYWYLGSAQLAFYGWLYFLVSGLASFALPLDIAGKVLFFALHILSAVFAYLFAKQATGNSRMAVVAALVYALSFEHIARIMVGRSITAMTYFLVPVLFLAYEKRLSGKLRSSAFVALAAIISSLLIFNHQADGIFVIGMFLLYAALRALETVRKSIANLGTEAIAAMMLAFVIVSFWAMPLIMELDEASGSAKAIEILMLKAPDIEIAKSAIAWPGIFGERQLYYVGISALALGAAGFYYLLRQKKYAIAITAASAMLLLLVQSARHAPVMLLMLGMSAAYGFAYLSKRLSVDSGKLLVVAVIIIAADLLPATAQLGYPDFSYTKEFYSRIDAADGERILDLSTDRRTFWPSYAYISGRAETVFGLLVESAPKSLPYAAAISQNAATEFYDLRQNFSEQTLSGLYLLGVKYVILHNEQPGKNPKEVFAEKKGALGLERNLEVIELEHSLVIASAEKMQITYVPMLEREEGWKLREKFEERSIQATEVDNIMASMGIDRNGAAAKRILVKDGGSEIIVGAEPQLQVRSITTTPGAVEIIYSVSSQAFLQLSYTDSSYVSVKIDGKEAQRWKTAINTIALKTDAGEHTITLKGRQTPLRNRLLAMSLAGIVVTLALLIAGMRKGKI